MLNVCKKLFSSWNCNQVDYCHWKSNEHLMEGLDGLTDLDVYVSPTHQKLADDLLRKEGFLQCLTQKSARYPKVEEWIGFDEESGKLIHVHLHFQVITGTKFCKEYVFPIDDLIIKTRVLDEETNVYVTDPNLEIIILYSRVVLKASNKKAISLDNDYTREIEYLKAHINKQTVLDYCKVLLMDNGDIFYKYIASDALNTEEWFSLYKIVRKWLNPYKKYSDVSVFFRHKYFLYRSMAIQLLNKKIGSHVIDKKTFPGVELSVCFIGQDGCGKSTITQDIRKWLNWKVASDRFYLGSGDLYNSYLKRLLERPVKNNKNAVLKEPKTANISTKKEGESKNVKQGVMKSIAVWGWNVLRAYYLAGIAKRSYKEVKKSASYMKCGGIALYDRFPQIQFEGLYDGPKINKQLVAHGDDNFLIRWFSNREKRWLEKTQKYQPTVLFKLVLPPEESLRRKPFEDYEAVCKKSKITEQLVFESSNVYTVDATQDYNLELLQVKRIIWRHLSNLCK